jgi:hypothetical protein
MMLFLGSAGPLAAAAHESFPIANPGDAAVARQIEIA